MKLHKKEIAKRQIDTAIRLFLDNDDYLSVITLAGAGEEILGGLLRRQGSESMMDHLVALDRRLTGGRDFSVVNEEVNAIRNALKHANKPEEDEIEIDPEHALAMLARAITNYHLLEKQLTDNMQRFYNWVRDNRTDLLNP